MMQKLYYNSQKDSELTNRIFELIGNAKSYIKTGNFFFQDPKLNEALIMAAERGVAIFVISNLRGDEERGKKYMKRDKEVSSETDPHIPHLHELHRKGIHVHLSNDLHAKFLIADGEEGLIMSANYTPNSLYGNPENGVDIIGEELDDLEYLFDVLFTNQDIVLSEDGDKYRYLLTSKPIDSNLFKDIGKKSKLIFTAKSSKNNLQNCSYTSIYTTIAEVINSAKEYLIMVSWSYKRINDLPLIRDAVRAAIKRGVNVTVLYSDKMSEDKLAGTERELPKLVGKENVKSCCHKFQANHSKCVLSEKKGVMFTANIDGDSGLLSGFEIGCILSDEQREQANNRINQILKNG